ncbi:MAG TPA: VCBS repeat-containing protein, partial [Polyangia bacterium]|nr:VCBS repeat-containing protein [Polyangia bacterium]
ISSANKGASWSVAGNLNGDAVDDVIIYNETDYDMTMLLSSAGGFTSTTLAKNSANSGTLYYVANPPSLVDINGDGLLDILAASGTTQPGTIEKFVNGGSATAPSFPATPVDIATGDSPVAQGFADFNCDGVLDIAVTTLGCNAGDQNCPPPTGEPPVLWILPGHGTGYDAALTTMIPTGAYNLAIADFNHDGYPDLVAASGGTTVTVLINTP